METVGHSEGGLWEKAPINRDTVMALLRNLHPERKAADQDDASAFAEEITAAGNENLADIGSQLERAQFATEYEREYPPGDGNNGGWFAAVGLARQVLAIAGPRYAAAKYEDDNFFEPYRPRLLDGPPPFCADERLSQGWSAPVRNGCRQGLPGSECD
ncbi:hypothetical protein K0651_10085 [Ornithinimicrobium sp. Arc0846-15]|nr:hypothetical protein [Ornithinimicrobium laminariae]